ncbi:MAG: helix-turn-helix transcriptional regulator [Actinobacteria bacterium]|nr:helix-turn-helix transcriptional regulator [Actinomycetota bacterium]
MSREESKGTPFLASPCSRKDEMKNEPSPTNDAKAVAHPLRLRILETIEQSGGIASPNQIAGVLDEPLGNVSYHVKTLLEYGWLDLVKTEPRRGAVEHFYARSDRARFHRSDSAILDKIAELVLPTAGLPTGADAAQLLAEILSLVEASGRAVA